MLLLTLLKRLETTFGVRGTVLDWFVSYLSGRFQSVIVDGVVSTSHPLVYGVPQGSVLGPVLFTLYSQPLSDVISVHNCDYHKYADDTELSKSAPPDQFLSVQSCIQTCIDDVLLWMNSNKLKLNTDKTEVMPVGSASRLESVGSECANRKHLACVLSRAPTNRVNPAVTVPKRSCLPRLFGRT